MPKSLGFAGFLDVPAGNVEGYDCVNKFGASPEVAADTQEDVWDGAGQYPWPTWGTAPITHLRQAVDQAGLRGALVEAQGLTITGTIIVQEKNLDAADTTTIVAWNTPMSRIFRLKVFAAVASDQLVQATNAAETVIYAQITIGKNQTLMALSTVPLGKTAYITQYYADHVRTTARDPVSVEFGLWVAEPANGFTFQLKHEKATSEQQTDLSHAFKPYLKVEELRDIKMTALPDTSPAHVHAGYDYILVNN